MSGNASFDELLARARKGDEAAWQPIIAELGPLVRGYLRAVGDPQPDQELLAVFEELAGDVDSYEGEIDEFVMYLFDIVISRQRRLRRPGIAPDRTSYSAPGFELDPDVRDAVLLRRLAKLEPTEIGYILGTTADQVKQWQVQGERELADEEWGLR